VTAAEKPTHWARDIKGRDVEYVVQDYLARGFVSSLYAPRDAGKTTAAIHLLASLSRGELFGADHPRRRSLFNSQEDSLQTVIKPRLEAHGADLGEPGDEHPWIAITDEQWTFPDDRSRLEAKLTQARDGDAPFDLVVLDSLAQHLVRLNSIEPMTRGMNGLIEIAKAFNLAILLIGHLTKSKGSTVESAIYGASVLQNLSKGIFVFGPIPDEPVEADADPEEGEEATGEAAGTGVMTGRDGLSVPLQRRPPLRPGVRAHRLGAETTHRDLHARDRQRPRLQGEPGTARLLGIRGLHGLAGQGVLEDERQGRGSRQRQDREGRRLDSRHANQQGGQGRGQRGGWPGPKEAGHGRRHLLIRGHLGAGHQAAEVARRPVCAGSR
jgi:hypothetical protein